jgi:hypothetical protein
MAGTRRDRPVNTPRSLQEWVHWLELGPGARWIRRIALLVGIFLLSLRVGYTQFHGPLSETTLAQAVAGRQIAEGNGYTTTIRYPQTLSVLRARGATPDFTRAWPELHQPPLYPALIGGAIRLLPARLNHALFQKAPVSPGGFGGDYLLLVLNVVLLWLAAWLTFLLGRRLFDEAAGLLAANGLLFCVSVWAQTVAVNGTPLMMVLLLGLFYLLVLGDETAVANKLFRPWFFASGVVCGLMFLCDYPAGLVVVPVLLYVGFRCTGSMRVAALVGVSIGFALLVAPWMSRNMGETGHPLALAGHDIALKAGDPTAQPEVLRNMLSAERPIIDLDKLGNKGLTGLKVALRDQLWSGGMLFTALFVVGLLYRFRSAVVNRMRWVFLLVLAVLVVAQAFFDSGEGERFPAIYAVPFMAIFGAGFFAVLVASNDKLAPHARWLSVVLLGLQALPLLHDALEPRRLHFNYPPYYPAVFVGMREDATRRGGQAWMADVPAGAAWYSGQFVWSQPTRLRDYYAIGADQPLYALVLTPHTLDRPFFSELNHIGNDPGLLGDWAQVYSGLITNRFPVGFSLVRSQKIADNLYVLFDPRVMAGPEK